MAKEIQSKSPSWISYYNYGCAALWSYILIATIYYPFIKGYDQFSFYEKTNFTLTIIQSLAIVEIYNSAVGNVRSPVFTTVVQVSSRLLVVWGIFQILPNSPANQHYLYTSLLLSWSITEIIRYTYYAQNIVTLGNPGQLLIFLRYNTFLVLYPTGVASETGLIYISLKEASKAVGNWYAIFLQAVLLIYIPGFYIMFTHMMAQRRKITKRQKQKQT
ncbi:hypothetical protein PACTADRAFT_3847 [Pachysolen tannophilus NRRL Y-2460]|uniref:Very-long-chain (3R)-3-hydroxyacyl-CoA dehydratase n=1 Tax=Pachysolen tannophilus NRRL Y-2460 TaxID=669874 RepID=A0A1E4TTA4_PACTA|nr:hypothetical protein PACTADRAFT_3847 [Pachysolen tannophilus NRRL Y-2460]